jgi:hypothetical protein
MKTRTFLIVMLTLLTPAAALAQSVAASSPPVASSSNDIVVRARRDAERKAIQTYVANISVRSESQLPRFHDPICPLVIGLDDRYARIAEQRIREVAVSIGASVAKKVRCDANLIVIMAESGSDLVRDIRIHAPGLLGDLGPHDVNALIAPAPARAWNVTSLRNEDGLGLFVPPPGSGPPTDPLADVPRLRVMSASYIKQPTRQDTEASFVVIDRAPMMGMALRQVADYAAMRGLAPTRPPKAGGSIDTILNAFEPGATVPTEMTSTDAAYLRALYRSDGLALAVTERNRIAREISKGK